MLTKLPTEFKKYKVGYIIKPLGKVCMAVYVLNVEVFETISIPCILLFWLFQLG